MSRTDRAVWGVVSSYAATLATAIAGFVIVPIVLRYVSREEYGLWAAVGQAIGYLALLDLGVGSAVIRRTAQLGPGESSAAATSRTVSTAVAVYAGLSVLLLAVGFLLTPVIPRLLSVPPGQKSIAITLFATMVVYGAVSLPLRVSMKALYGLQQMARANVVMLVENVLSPAVAAVLLASGIGLIALPLGGISAGFVAAALAAVMLTRVAPGIRVRWQDVSAAEARELFTWSWLLGVNSLAVVIIYQTDTLVVAARGGLGPAATYALTSRLPLYAMPVIFALADSCLPAAIELCAQRQVDRVRDLHVRVLRLSLGAAICAAVVATTFNEPFVQLWVGAQNYGGTILTLAFGLMLVYRVLMQTAGMVVIGTGRLRGVVAMSVVEAALNLTLSLWWIGRFGLAGVAMATVVAGLSTSAWYVTRLVCRELRQPVAGYLWSGLAIPALCGLPAAALAVVMRRTYALTSWAELAVAMLVTAIVYVATFIAFAADSHVVSAFRRTVTGAVSAFRRSLTARRWPRRALPSLAPPPRDGRSSSHSQAPL